MSEQTLNFDRSAHSLDAVQRAAYRLSDRLAATISADDDAIEVELSYLEEGPDRDALVAEFRNEVLDQVLRERIRSETEDVRRFVLSLAFSQTELSHNGDG
jgi:His-Xaa-Ser system protein HxsD